MKMLKTAIIVSVLYLSTSANAALVGRLATTEGGTDYQAYYDTEADLTWLANANAAGTTMNWPTANTWVADLDVAGVVGWRLPATLQPDSSCSVQTFDGISRGYNCTGSEMGNLFYNVLGGTAGVSIAASHNANYDLFRNIEHFGYWSATEYAPYPLDKWLFDMWDGEQSHDYEPFARYAWAVQSGDVSAVPVPAAAWLFGSGLIGLIGVARRKKA